GRAASCAGSIGAGREPCRQTAPRRRTSPRHGRHSDGDGRGSIVSRSSLFQDQLLERQVRHSLAQTVVLFLKLLQPLHLVTLQAAELLAPAVIRELRHADRANRLANRFSLRQQNIDLAQLRDDLFGLMLFLGHSNVLSNGSIAYFREDHFSGGRPRPATGSSSDTVVALRLSDRALVASLLEAIVAKIDQTVGQDFLAKQRQSVVQRLEEVQESIATYKRAIARLDASLVQLERQTDSDLSIYPTTTNTLVGLMENLRKLNDTQRTLLQEMEEIPSSIVKERVSQPRLIGPSSTRIALAIAVVTSLGLLIFV